MSQGRKSLWNGAYCGNVRVLIIYVHLSSSVHRSPFMKLQDHHCHPMMPLRQGITSNDQHRPASDWTEQSRYDSQDVQQEDWDVFDGQPHDLTTHHTESADKWMMGFPSSACKGKRSASLLVALHSTTTAKDTAGWNSEKSCPAMTPPLGRTLRLHTWISRLAASKVWSASMKTKSK